MRFTTSLRNVPEAHGPAVELAIRQFHECGKSVHSLDGTILAPLLNHLVESNVPFTLRHVPRGGWYVEYGPEATHPTRSRYAHSSDPAAIAAVQGDSSRADDAAGDSAPDAGRADVRNRAESLELTIMIDVITAHIAATKGTALSPQYLRLMPEDIAALRAYMGPADPVPTLCGLPVEELGSKYDRARQERGEVGFAIPREAIASKE